MARLKRRGAMACAAVLTWFVTSSVWALGLGEIELDSALNEKLKAEIQLLDASGLEPTEILVSLASNEDFERVGVERFFFLNDLRFSVAADGRGRPVIQVASSQPISEPFVNFLVEVLWPSGRLLKEYTLLLDPPTFSQAAAPDVTAPSRGATAGAPAGTVQRSAPERPPASLAGRGTQVQVPQAPRGAASADRMADSNMTTRNDTLWAIASRTLPSSAVSVQQNMLAIKALNPNAFINNNINLLKAGYVLRLPTEAQALALAEGEAKQLVAQDNQAWRAMLRGEPVPQQQPVQVAQATPAAEVKAQVDARPAQPAKPAQANTDGQLRIIAGEGDSVQGSAESDPQAVAAAMEEQDRLQREVEELRYELDRSAELATNQLEVKERQLDVKDQQIAELQAQVEQLRKEMAASQAQQSQNQSAGTDAKPWWQSPYVLGGGAGVLVLLLGYGLLAARRRRAAEQEALADALYAEEPQVGPAVTVAAGAGMAAAAEVAADEAAEEDQYDMAGEDGGRTTLDDLTDAWEADNTGSAEDDDASYDEAANSPPAEDFRPSETSDVIGEADIYIAYGRYPQAVSLLLGALEEDPNQHEVRLKLLDLYGEINDREAFNEHMSYLLEHTSDQDVLHTAREIESRLSELDLGELNGDITGEAPAAPPVEADEGAEPAADDEAYAAGGLDDFELELDDDLTATDDADPALEDRQSPGADSAAHDALDFELELEDGPTTADAPGGDLDLDDLADAGHGDELGGDLGINFNPDTAEQDALSDLDDTLDSLADEADQPAAAADGDFDLDDLGIGDNQELGDEFDFADEGDTASTKLDLARAYIDMGDQDGARDILNEVLTEGNEEQQKQAQELLETI